MDEKKNKFKDTKFVQKIKSLNKKQWIWICTVVVVIIATVVSSVLVVQHKRRMAELASSHKVVTTTKKPTTTQPPTTTEPPVMVKVHMECSSFKEDLKITIINEETKKWQDGTEFSVVLTDSKNKQKTYKDTNKNGKIYINKITAGKYKVKLNDVEGYEITANDIDAVVKAKANYKVNQNILKKTSNIKGEDMGKKHSVPFEGGIKDTVPPPAPPTTNKPVPPSGNENKETPDDTEDNTKPSEKVYSNGWHNINGAMYYYVNNLPMQGEQVIGGIKYYFDSNGVLQKQHTGIDVSYAQGNINWSQVKNTGRIGFAIIRIARRGGGSSGSLGVDTEFKNNIKGVIANKIPFGVYFFSQATDNDEARDEASYCVKTLEKYGIHNYNLSLPIYIDTEDLYYYYNGATRPGRANSIKRETRTQVCETFCRTIQNAGYKAGVYANKDFFTNRLYASRLSKYNIWLAQYNSHVTYGGKYGIWQYSSSGHVPGISSKHTVDLNYR